MRQAFSLCFSLFLILCLYFTVVTAKPSKDRPDLPFDPVGVWQGEKGQSLYLVTIAAEGKNWRSTWENENGRVIWAGLLTRTLGGFVEKYDPNVNRSPDWTWKEDGPGLLGTDAWKLSVVPDF